MSKVVKVTILTILLASVFAIVGFYFLLVTFSPGDHSRQDYLVAFPVEQTNQLLRNYREANPQFLDDQEDDFERLGFRHFHFYIPGEGFVLDVLTSKAFMDSMSTRVSLDGIIRAGQHQRVMALPKTERVEVINLFETKVLYPAVGIGNVKKQEE